MRNWDLFDKIGFAMLMAGIGLLLIGILNGCGIWAHDVGPFLEPQRAEAPVDLKGYAVRMERAHGMDRTLFVSINQQEAVEFYLAMTGHATP